MRIQKVNTILNNTKEWIKYPYRFSFEKIALDLYDLHRLHNKNYRKYSIGKLDDWRKIPLAPASQFSKRKMQLSETLGVLPVNSMEFISKGEKPKHHLLRDTEFLRASIYNNFSYNILNIDGIPSNRMVFIDNKKSNSILSYMYEYLSTLYDFRGVYEYLNPLDPVAVKEFMESTSDQQLEPLIIIGTPNLFYDLKLTVDTLDVNSIVNTSAGVPTIIQFGDYIELSKMDLTLYELNDWLTKFFHTSLNDIIQVYYSTELSSQLFRWGENLSYMIPHTVSVRVLNPDTGEEMGPGVEGNLAFIDTANVWSCPFIISDDLGVMYNNNNAVQIIRKSNEILRTGVNPRPN